MTDDTPATITTNTNTDTTDSLKPDSNVPWQSNPDETAEPTITVELPQDSTITKVSLVDPQNVASYTVIVTDENGDSKTVCFWICFYSVTDFNLQELYVILHLFRKKNGSKINLIFLLSIYIMKRVLKLYILY
jgi:hypothetical protein